MSARLWRLLDSNLPADSEIDEILRDRGLHLECKAKADTLQLIAAPCGDDFVLAVLEPSVLVYGVSDAARTKAFWGVYLKALRDIPAEALANAVDAYAALPDSQYFPKPGPLKALATKHAESIRKAAYRAKRAADSLPRPQRSEETPEERKRIAAEVVETFKTVKRVPE